MAMEKGLLYSTLQQEDETCPSLGIGATALLSSIICEPSGIFVFLSSGTSPTIVCLSDSVNASLDKDLLPMKSYF